MRGAPRSLFLKVSVAILAQAILAQGSGSSVQSPQREAATRVLSPSALMAKAMRKAMRKGSNTVSHNLGQMAFRTQTSGKKWQHRRLPK